MKKKLFLLFVTTIMVIKVSAQMNIWENGELSAQYVIEDVDSVTFGITSVTPSSGIAKDGITPLLKIDDDYWYVSYDEGKTWQKEGRAKGEDGDSMFESVTIDDKFIYFTLVDGTSFKLEKNLNNQTPEGDDIIEFKDLYLKSVLVSSSNLNLDENEDGEISFVEAKKLNGLSMTNHSDLRSFKEFKYFTNVKKCSFSGCTNLFEITLPESIDTIFANAFGNSSSSYACQKLTHIIIPEGCKYIGNYAFANTSLYKISIPEGCDYIGERAFYYTKIKSIELSNTVKTIGSYAFYISGSDRLESFRFPKDFITGGSYIFNALPHTIYWDAINCQNYKISNKTSSDATIIDVVLGEEVEYVPNSLCQYLSKLENINFPNSVKSIGAGAFYGCSSLVDIIFPADLELINSNAFYGCSSLKEIVIPNKVQIIDKYAFQNCSNVTEIVLGEGLEIINDYAFSGTNPTKIFCKAKYPPYIGSNALPTTAIIYVPRESVSEYRTTWSAYASKIMGYDFE